ncbi:uncharacterized mitochondrial protein AtMg00310-like [Humulus lupulus]|uniref:uncharacterized mitochondrial protein AtMg00310-like n=1 Tax=Humulus lupulus TaxID=3486 RepID=UPI002B406273|nr:uncharacterized mitochondrial protein AtMg00310-like [Humulus lupulus]
MAGREVLIKAVIQSIPTYTMSLFKLPMSFVNSIHGMCARFWWGGDDTKQKMHWCTWGRLWWHKEDGGMGFRDLHLFNQAMLAKQAWRLYDDPSSLAAKVLKGLYHRKKPFGSMVKSKNGSFVWKNILWGKELFDAGSIWRVGKR